MKASELFVKSLEAAGVTHVFGVPGEENLAFLEALRNSPIKFITTRHEQSAVFMAATHGRLTGRVGVALSTLGPGATNLVTGVAYAQLGGMPLLVITGQKPIKRSKQGKFQLIDVVDMMRPITKSAETIVSADRIPTSVYQAIHLAEAERPGAVHLELPEDIAEENSDELPISRDKTRRAIADEKSLAALTTAIETASKPVILVAAGANRKRIGKQLENFVSHTRIPFVTTQMGKGVLDESSDLYLGTTALTDGDFVHSALRKADLVLMIGHDITEKPPVLRSGRQRVAHINFYPADIDYVYQPELEAIGDISYTLWQLSERVRRQDHWDLEAFTPYRMAQLADTLRQSDSDAFPLTPQRFVADLRRTIPGDGILSLDNGMYKLWIARNYPAYQQNTVLLDNALATMGAGLSAGMGVQLLGGGHKTVVVSGDGGFVMGMADLITAVQLNLDLVVIILNDNAYGMIKWKQASMGLPDYGLDFMNPDFVRLAESMGAHGHRVTSAAEFAPMLAAAMEAGGIHVIDVPIDYAENETLGVSAWSDDVA